jgi:hypothetical protein
MALEERLNRAARERGVDVMVLRRQVAFDRLLARILAETAQDIVLKGGYALLLRLERARTTKDIDLSFRGSLGGIWQGTDKSAPSKLQQFLQDRCCAELADFFEFTIGEATLDLENAPYGGYRFPVAAIMAGRPFIAFSIDMAAGDTWIEPHEMIETKDWLGFAGIEPPQIPAISNEQQFAEKLHAYTVQRQRANSRVKDLVDLVVLLRRATLAPHHLRFAVARTFERRQSPGVIVVPDPPSTWRKPFASLASQCGVETDMHAAADELRAFCRSVELGRTGPS